MLVPHSLHFQVTVIVMITKLVEGNILKADQYWPDEEKESSPAVHGLSSQKEQQILDLGGGCRVQHISTEQQGGVIVRQDQE